MIVLGTESKLQMTIFILEKSGNVLRWFAYESDSKMLFRHENIVASPKWKGVLKGKCNCYLLCLKAHKIGKKVYRTALLQMLDTQIMNTLVTNLYFVFFNIS